MSIASEVVKDVASPIRGYLELGALVVLLGAFAWFIHHERQIGASAIAASDTKALQADQKRAAAETALNIAKAAKADEEADHVQAAVDQYRNDHPEQPIRLCHANNSVPSPSPGGASKPGSDGPRPGSAPVQAVLDGSDSTEGPDISPNVDAVLRAAGRVAVLYDDLRRRR